MLPPIQKPVSFSKMPTPKVLGVLSIPTISQGTTFALVAWFGVFGATLFAVNYFYNYFLQFQLINAILQGYHGNVVTREQVLLNADMVAAASIEEPVPEREAATFEAVPEPVKVVAAAVPEAVAETAPVEAEAVAQEPTPIKSHLRGCT